MKHMKMDEILTTGRATVREQTWNTLRDIIKTYDMGLLITDVTSNMLIHLKS